jgi:hypothetical protein
VSLATRAIFFQAKYSTHFNQRPGAPGQRSFRFAEQDSGSIAETQTNKDVTNEEQPVGRRFSPDRSCAG